MSAYRDVIASSQNISPKVVDSFESRKTLDEALQSYETLVRIGKQSSSKSSVFDEALSSIHADLKDYWMQFGFLEKSQVVGFQKWADGNFKLRETKTFQPFEQDT